MKKLALLILFSILSFSVHSQYRWEFSGGPTFSKFNIDNTESTAKTGFYANIGYGYVMGIRARKSVVFSLDFLQRTSEIEGIGEVSTTQVGFNPKFRFLFFRGKNTFRPFINIGPTVRVTTKFELAGEVLEDNEFEQLIVGGVYGIGFSQMVGEMFDIFFETGVMNDFQNHLPDREGNTRFFDYYARLGLRFRIYDSKR